MIAFHAPHLHPLAADPVRMHRQLGHEVTHVCAAERTGSIKRLGDGDVGMRIRPWFDEGFAVWVAARAAAQPFAALGGGDTFASLDELDHALRALDSHRRAAAFAVATARVASAIARHGVHFVFDHLDAPEACGSSSRAC